MLESEIDVERLIPLVEERPSLWDRTQETYKQRQITKDAWRQICQQLLHDFEGRSSSEKKQFAYIVNKKWTNIRDSWIKAWKKEKEYRETGLGPKPRKYRYHDEVSFLRKIVPKIAEKPTKSEETPRKHPTVPKSSKILPQNECVQRPTASSELTNSQNNSSIRVRKRKLVESESVLPKAGEKNESVDANLNFFKGLLPLLKGFTNDQTIDFQMGVLMLIKTIKSKNAVSTSHSSQRVVDIPVQIYTPHVSPYDDYQQSSVNQIHYQSSAHKELGTNHYVAEQSNKQSHQIHENSTSRKVTASPVDGRASSNSNSRITTLSPPSPTDSNLSCISDEIDIHFE